MTKRHVYVSEVAEVVETAVPTVEETAVVPRPEFKAPLGTVESPYGVRDPSHRIFWHGRTITGLEHIGSAPTGMQANLDATALGCATCHQSFNTDFIEPDAAPFVPPAADVATAKEQNAFYVAGFEDGQAHQDSQYQDLKALVQAWATIQAMDGADLDEVPMVVYIRHH